LDYYRYYLSAAPFFMLHPLFQKATNKFFRPYPPIHRRRATQTQTAFYLVRAQPVLSKPVSF